MDYILPGALILAIIVIIVVQSNRTTYIPMTHDTQPKLPWHLTSHRTTDNPCICQCVYNTLKEHGFTPDKMTTTEATDAYHALWDKYPDLPRLSVV